ncbi:hypothetical protein [Luteococcus sanguinis]|uniref:Uncharacterized protein n=1 Tax=Luteococcus sanguinis TaxID=174038 RepID=A0ABW1X1Z0_9ACTN
MRTNTQGGAVDVPMGDCYLELGRQGLDLFDPEEVGSMMRRGIQDPVDDVQSWPAWGALVTETAIQLAEHHGTDIVCPVTLL